MEDQHQGASTRARRHIRITFMIGLGDPTGTLLLGDWAGYLPQERAARRESHARALLARAYEAGTYFNGDGLWRGVEEPTLQFQTIQPDSDTTRDGARRLALEIAGALGQEALGLAFDVTELELLETTTTDAY